MLVDPLRDTRRRRGVLAVREMRVAADCRFRLGGLVEISGPQGLSRHVRSSRRRATGARPEESAGRVKVPGWTVVVRQHLVRADDRPTANLYEHCSAARAD